jgi:D-alanyl-D-alanine carboxypeptidase
MLAFSNPLILEHRPDEITLSRREACRRSPHDPLIDSQDPIAETQRAIRRRQMEFSARDQLCEHHLGKETSMRFDSRSSQRSIRARLNRRHVLGLAAAGAVGSMAVCSRRGTAAMVTLTAPWAAELTETISALLPQTTIPGAIVGVWQEGQRDYTQAFGVQDPDSGEPMTLDLYIRIGSNTKSFTTTAILQLVDQGRLDLDDPIETYVAGVPNGDQITIRQLGMMRSGLPDYTEQVIWRWADQPQRQWTAEELLAIAFRQPLRFAPGTAFDYNNTNTVLLGVVVEQVTGQSLRDSIDEHILEPEGLTHTSFPVGAEFPAPHPHGYWRTPAGEIVDTTDWNTSWGGAAGQMISTLADLRVWAHALATGTLLTPATQEQREQFLPAPDEGEGVVYGFGMTDNNGWRGHDGNVLGYVTYPFYLPTQQMTLVVLLNSSVDVLDSVAMMQAITRVISPDNVWPNPPAAPVTATPAA